MKVKRPERPIDPADWQRRINLRLRAEFIARAEGEWRKRTGRPMTAEEFERVLRRYSGDVQAGLADSASCGGTLNPRGPSWAFEFESRLRHDRHGRACAWIAGRRT